MGVNRNCEKCDFNHMCLVKDTDNCPFDSPMMRIANMSDQEAADILKRHLQAIQFPRGNEKSTQTLRLIRAISKGIEALEKGENYE